MMLFFVAITLHARLPIQREVQIAWLHVYISCLFDSVVTLNTNINTSTIIHRPPLLRIMPTQRTNNIPPRENEEDEHIELHKDPPDCFNKYLTDSNNQSLNKQRTTMASSLLQQQQYQTWLQSKNVTVKSSLIETTRNNVVAGWGCVAKCDIKKGVVLFRIPRGACFGAAHGEEEKGVAKNSSRDAQDNDDKNQDSEGKKDDFNTASTNCSSNEDPTTSDTQKELALRLLQHKHSSDWSPFLNLLTPHPLPWTWPRHFRQAVLKGTELEHVVENKVKRIQMEYDEICTSVVVGGEGGGGELSISYQEYLDATSIVASHANPWFGVSIVPFNTTLNWGSVPNVEFDLDEDEVIVGKTTRRIKKGQELFQRYGESVVELVYRCGFAPTFDKGDGEMGRDSMEGDVVSLCIHDIVGLVEETLMRSNDGNGRSTSSSTKVVTSNNNSTAPPTSTVISHLPARLEALKQSGAIDDSPWDGMKGWDHVTAELSLPSSSFMQRFEEEKKHQTRDDAGAVGLKRKLNKNDGSHSNSDMNDEERSAYDDGGVSKLIGICLVLSADEESWQRASRSLNEMERTITAVDDGEGTEKSGKGGKHNNDTDEEDENNSDAGNCDESSDEDDEESRSDDITAAALLSSFANLSSEQSMQLQQRALNVGSGGHDPWRALLLDLIDFEDGVDMKKKRKRSSQSDSGGEAKQSVSWSVAFDASKAAIQQRMDKLVEGEKACEAVKSGIKTGRSGTDECVEKEAKLTASEQEEALGTIAVLRGVEKSILLQALGVLESSF